MSSIYRPIPLSTIDTTLLRRKTDGFGKDKLTGKEYPIKSVKANDYGATLLTAYGELNKPKVFMTGLMRNTQIAPYLNSDEFSTLLSPVEAGGSEKLHDLAEKIRTRLAELVFEAQADVFPAKKNKAAIHYSKEEILEATKPFLNHHEEYGYSLKAKFAWQHRGGVQDRTAFDTIDQYTPFAVNAMNEDLKVDAANIRERISSGTNAVYGLIIPQVFCKIQGGKPEITPKVQIVHIKVVSFGRSMDERREEPFSADVSQYLGFGDGGENPAPGHD